MTDDLSALDIYQAHLDLVTRAAWAQDLDTLDRYIALPTRVEMSDAVLTMTTPEERREAFLSFNQSLETIGATGYIRIASQASFQDAAKTMIRGRHTTYILDGGSYALPPFESEQELRFEDGIWKGVNLYSTVSNSTVAMINPVTARRKALQNASAVPDESDV